MTSNIIKVYDWKFDIHRLCEDCGKSPFDCWNMANIEVKSEKPGMYQMKWVCMNCLGTRVVQTTKNINE